MGTTSILWILTTLFASVLSAPYRYGDAGSMMGYGSYGSMGGMGGMGGMGSPYGMASPYGMYGMGMSPYGMGMPGMGMGGMSGMGGLGGYGSPYSPGGLYGGGGLGSLGSDVLEIVFHQTDPPMYIFYLLASTWYSDFEINLHRQLRECVLSLLKEERGILSEQVAKSICSKMEEATKKSDWQCVFGKKFGMCMEFERDTLLYCHIGDTALIFYRCAPEQIMELPVD